MRREGGRPVAALYAAKRRCPRPRLEQAAEVVERRLEQAAEEARSRPDTALPPASPQA